MSRLALPTMAIVPSYSVGVAYPVSQTLEYVGGSYRIRDLDLGTDQAGAEAMYVSYLLSTGDYPLPGTMFTIMASIGEPIERQVLATIIGKPLDLEDRYRMAFMGTGDTPTVPDSGLALRTWWSSAYGKNFDDTEFICLVEFVLS